MSLVARHALKIAAYVLTVGVMFGVGTNQSHAQTPATVNTWHPMVPGWYRPYIESSQPDIFYNHYVPGNGGNPAAIYPAPHPTPARVGHTYYTYQPFMPSEWMYQHHRTYHQHYNAGMGLNRTKVTWYAPPVQTLLSGVRRHFRLAR